MLITSGMIFFLNGQSKKEIRDEVLRILNILVDKNIVQETNGKFRFLKEDEIEIENEINGPANAYQYVNEVLARARNTANGTTTEPANFSGLTQEEFRSRILRERQYEMLAEGHEFYDTRRRGYKYFLDEVVTIHNNYPTFDPRKDFVYPISIKNMLLPIPSIEFSGNRAISVADQNPGY